MAAIQPHSCLVCQSRLIFTLGNYSSSKGWYDLIDENWFATGEAYTFNISFEQALAQAKRGCECFMWLVTLRRPDTWTGSFLRAYFAHNSNEQMVLDWVDELTDHIDGGDMKRKLIICAEESDTAASEITHRPPKLLPASQDSMQKARNWLKTCIESHEDCPKPIAGGTQVQNSTSSKVVGPGRLIKISGTIDNPTLVLVRTVQSFWQQYVALSYCWGGDQNVKLLRQNLVEWQIEIPYSGLLQTIKDAVRVTMELGFSYLWIDALCIIQDSDDDKAVELSRMADIYEHAYVTISAARALKAQDGFLHSRYIPGERGYRMPFMSREGQLGSVILWRGREPGVWEPIDQRAWCLQESILSPRVLEFGTHNTRWHCAHNRTEESRVDFDGWIAHSETFAQHGVSHVIIGSIDWDAVQDPWKFVGIWQGLVIHYTSRGIGRQSDKLLAISAVARKIGRVTQKKYIAGLWQEHIGDLLLWYPDYNTKKEEKPYRISSEYVAPSWSWASFAGEISFSSGSAIHGLELVGVQVENRIQGDAFSSVKNARLELKASSLTVRVRMEEWGHILWNQETQEEANAYGTFDVPLDAAGKEVAVDDDVLLALIMPGEGLMLKLQPDGKMYARVGRFQRGQRYDDPDIWKERNITIV